MPFGKISRPFLKIIRGQELPLRQVKSILLSSNGADFAASDFQK
jgi:hypothetical protein